MIAVALDSVATARDRPACVRGWLHRVGCVAMSVRLETWSLRKSVQVSRMDIEDIEEAGDALIRSGHTQTAIKLYALALRLRSETGLHPQRRRDDAVT